MEKIFSFAFILMVFTVPFKAQASDKTIKPHKAIYTISLRSAQPDSMISKIHGKMIIELKRDCSKGWTLVQDSANVIELKNSPSEVMRSRYVAWESDDGKKLKFFSERIYNERVSDRVDGDAHFNAEGGSILYKNPEKHEVAMEADTIPPISHMQKLIDIASTGEGITSGKVFDGSFYGNPVLINTFIGQSKKSCADHAQGESAWPMNLAVYAQPSTGESPNFELTQVMANNGVMCSYTINFGDYTVQGKLDKLEFLPERKCNK